MVIDAGLTGFLGVRGSPEGTSAEGDPLETLAATVDFEVFPPGCKASCSVQQGSP